MIYYFWRYERNENYFLDSLALMVLCFNGYSHTYYVAFFGRFHINRKRLSLFF